MWAHNGRELFFVNRATRQVMTAEFTATGGTFQRRSVTPLFEFPATFILPRAHASDYDVAPGDERFLMARRYEDAAEQEAASSTFILVNNFFEELKERVPN